MRLTIKFRAKKTFQVVAVAEIPNFDIHNAILPMQCDEWKMPDKEELDYMIEKNRIIFKEGSIEPNSLWAVSRRRFNGIDCRSGLIELTEDKEPNI